MATSPNPICRRVGGLGPRLPGADDLDFAPCFHDAVAVAFYAILVACALPCIWILYRRLDQSGRSKKSKWLLATKTALLAAATVLTLFEFGAFQSITDTLQLTYLAIHPLAVLSYAIVTYLDHVKTRVSSPLLLVFFPLDLVIAAVRLRSIASHHSVKGSVLFGAQVTIPSLILISYILECFGPEIPDTPIRLLGPESSLESQVQNGKVELTVKDHPLATANIYSIWSFGWITPLMKLGSRKFINEDDLDNLLETDTSTKLGERLRYAIEKHPGSLWLALFRAYGAQYGFAAFLKIFQDALAFLQPQLLRWLLSFIAEYQRARFSDSDKEPHPLEGFIVAILMFAAGVTQSVILHQYFQICFTTGMRVRAGLITSIYRKTLVLSSEEKGQRATGDIVNLMSVDATRMQDLCTYGLITISGPFQITLAFVSLYNLLGWPAFVGVAVMIFSVPLNTMIASYMKKLQVTQMKNRDARTRMMSELLMNVKSVKLYAWEDTWIKRVLDIRNGKEVKMLRKIGIVTALNGTLWSGIPLLVSFTSFTVAAYAKSSKLTADVIFPSISLFMLLGFPLAMFAQVTSNVIEALVSVNRLKQFLDANELQKDALNVIVPERKLSDGDDVLIIKSGEFAWSKSATSSTLYDINVTAKKGELVGVFGRVGAGKSSLLSAIVGEMIRVDGDVTLRGSVAYVPQNPWIMSATVRENILFSHAWDEEFYELVLDACALREDLAILKEGDMTEVGEKGITLSGGQRSRIALARALYARADLYLLDDVLSAVDSHVARHVFDRVIGPNGILATKARILVTNSISFVSQFDQVCYLRRGAMLESGTFPELISNPAGEFYKLVTGHGKQGSATPGPSSGTATPRHEPEDDSTLASRSSPGDEKLAELFEKEVGEAFREKAARRRSFGAAVLAPEQILPPRGEAATAAKQEHREQGQVKRAVYAQYIKAASLWGFTLYIVVSVLSQVAAIAGTYALRAFGDDNESHSPGGISKYIWIYGLLSLSSTIFSAVGAILLFVMCTLKAARLLHDKMLHAVMRAPLSFFETTPIGRILNLFTRDVSVVDTILGWVISAVTRTMISVIGIMLVIGASFPLFLVCVPPLAYFYYLVMVYYLATSRELKRLDAVSKSPIFAWFSESLSGLSTIRGFRQQGIFITGIEKRIDRNQMCYLPSVSCNRWLAIRLEFIGSIIILIAALVSLWKLVTIGVDAGLVGLVLSYGLNVTGALNWAVRSASELETNLVSVERILQYVHLEPEAPYRLPESNLPKEWPTRGTIEFSDYSMRYRPELDLVLKNISMTINGSEKIGVCGRTGAGKSSLLLALFRIIEPAGGKILVDGVDVTKIGLHDLRSSISIIPQEPQLFEGTLRENVDPTGKFEDSQIWAALSQSYLREYVESLEGGLDAPVREGGSSMSSGQRQLLCFARALLRGTKVLVLDEATSAVDLETDKAIQEIIRGPQFANVTMLTIAHRLNTIIEYDRVLVLDAGKVAELDSPQKLLENKESKFYGLAAEAGLTSD